MQRNIIEVIHYCLKFSVSIEYDIIYSIWLLMNKRVIITFGLTGNEKDRKINFELQLCL